MEESKSEKQIPLPQDGKRVKKSGKAPLIAAACAIGAVVIGFAVVCVIAGRSTTILRGVDAFGIDFGGQTPEQAAKTLEECVVRGEGAGALFRVDEGHEVFKSYEQLGMTLECTETAQALYDYGRSGNALANGWRFIFAGRAEIEPVWRIDEAQREKAAHEISDELTYAPVDFSYTVDETGLYAVKPCDGQTMRSQSVIDACQTSLCTGASLHWEFGTDSPATAPAHGDYAAYLREVHQQLAQPCVNAGYDKETDSILNEKVHADFSLDDAVAKWTRLREGRQCASRGMWSTPQ